MQRYTVTLVSDTGGHRPSILVPFQPSALVSTFKDEIYKRSSRNNLPVNADTHDLTLRLQSQTGAALDPEDELSSVVLGSETVYAVFSLRNVNIIVDLPTRSDTLHGLMPIEGDTINVRLVTPATARQSRNSLQTFPLSVNATLQQLHEQAAQHLQVPLSFEQSAVANECNCSFARKLSDHHASSSTSFVIYDKSAVESIDVSFPTKTAVVSVLQERFGVDIESQKKLHYFGGELLSDGQYSRLPVVAVCSQHRHVPIHAKSELPDESNQAWVPVLDLHTSKMPIRSSAMHTTVKTSGLLDLCADGILDLFAVHRSTSPSSNQVSVGREALFRARAFWSPPVKQSNRGMAMFLSVLRVTASLMQDMEGDSAALDAVLHVFDLMSAFTPALRTLYLLAQGKTPSAVECAALSHSVFHILEGFIPVELVGTNRTRLFEGSRLLFGFLLEKGKSIKLHASQLKDIETWPYMCALKTNELRSCTTHEPVMDPVFTQAGIVEKNYYRALIPGGLLASKPIQPTMIEENVEAATVRLALLSGGMHAELATFSRELLEAHYAYEDAGRIADVVDDSELGDLHYLAEISARNHLAVRKPSQLASAVAPCLTFDRNAHVACYLGEQGCGEAGRSSLVFRPCSGTEVVDTSIIEQLIAPIIKTYEAEGTGVFDASGGAELRKLEAPDEILMFCVDVSASMRSKTDFAEVNDEEDDDLARSTVDPLQPNVEGEYYETVRFEDMKEELCKHESFDDMVAIIANARDVLRSKAATAVLAILNTITATQLSTMLAEAGRTRMGYNYGGEYRLDSRVKRQKSFYAGLRTHEQQIKDFLVYRATTSTPRSKRWSWSPGDDVPTSATRSFSIPMLPDELTMIPDDLRCPISLSMMDDPVLAGDGHTYSRYALRQWFEIRKSSPLHGTSLEDTGMVGQEDLAQAAVQWVNGEGLVELPQQDDDESRPAKRTRPSPVAGITLKFNSHLGGFVRRVPKNLSLNDLYKLAFRGLKARHNTFQLARGNAAISPSSTATVTTRGLWDGASITVRIADDTDSSEPSASGGITSGELALVKVYRNTGELDVAYWVDRNSPQTTASVFWKYWRAHFEKSSSWTVKPFELWTGMMDSGDGFCRGSVHKDSTQRLSTYLDRNHCFGQLGDETVYNDREAMPSQTLVLKVYLSSPQKESRRSVLSRLDVLKQMFEALINRLLAYNYTTHVGLVTFSSTAAVAMPISHVIENFRRATIGMNADGDTALWDALSLAEDQVAEYGAKYPDAKKRIICISDGEDTKSTLNTAESVAWNLLQKDVAMDSIYLGGDSNTSLQAISDILGCYKLSPFSLANALAMCEMEVVLGLVDRPDIVSPVHKSYSRSRFMSSFLSRRYYVQSTVVNDHTFPPRRSHPNLQDSFIPLADAARIPAGHATTTAGGARSNLRTTRLLREMKQIVTGGPRATYDVYVSETDMTFWKVVMQGPSDTPYAGGTFMLYIHAEEKYPAFAPKARFVTRIMHPNVSKYGRICLSILDRDWTSDTSMTRLLDTIFGMLLQAETSDPVNTTITLGYHHDQVEFNEEVRRWTRRYANQTREEWRQALLEGENWDGLDGGEDEDDEDDEDGLELGSEDDEMED